MMLWFMLAPLKQTGEFTFYDNLDYAKNWGRFLINSGLDIVAPWVGYCEMLDDFNPDERKRGQQLCLVVLDSVISSGGGGVIVGRSQKDVDNSSGIHGEIAELGRRNAPILNFAGLSFDEATELLRKYKLSSQ